MIAMIIKLATGVALITEVMGERSSLTMANLEAKPANKTPRTTALKKPASMRMLEYATDCQKLWVMMIFPKVSRVFIGDASISSELK